MKNKANQCATQWVPQISAVSRAVHGQIHGNARRAIAAALLGGALAMPQIGATQDLVLEEIIVTAQKRAENLQDVPISVTALDSTKLEQLGISNFNEYLAMLPSVSYKDVGPDRKSVV